LAPTVFWGHQMARGTETAQNSKFSLALILMGDWCGLRCRAATTMTENQGAEAEVTPLRSENKASEHTKSVEGVVRRIDTSLLMGDSKLFSPFNFCFLPFAF